MPQTQIDEVNELLESEVVQKLIKKGFKFSEEYDVVCKLSGLLTKKGTLVLKDRDTIMIYGKVKIDRSKILATYSVDFAKLAAELKFDEIHIPMKDYPCIISKEGKDSEGFTEALILAPKIKED